MRIRLPSADALDQEELFAANGVLGKILGRHAVCQEIEDSIYAACSQHPTSVSLYTQGKFQAILLDGEAVAKLLAEEWRVHRCPVYVERWSVEGCANLDEMDKNLFWARLPKLPPQCLKPMRMIEEALDTYMGLRTLRQEVLNGTIATICVQVPCWYS